MASPYLYLDPLTDSGLRFVVDRMVSQLREGGGFMPRQATHDPTVSTHVLPSGMTVLSERVPGMRSVTLGVWVKVGSRSEIRREQGVSHVVEHMLFKGTPARSARAIAEALEFVGGESNAFTAREYTCYYAKVASPDFRLAADVLSDIVMNSSFSPEEFEKERRVILEEISMYEDNAEEYALERLFETVLDPALGHPITGSREAIRALPRETAHEYYRRYYHPGNVFLTLVGDLDEEKVLEQSARFWPGGSAQGGLRPRQRRGELRSGTFEANRPIEQVHLYLALPGVSMVDPDRHAVNLTCAYLGGGMSSRLFQEVRERRGLAYGVGMFAQSYRDVGFQTIYCGTSRANVSRVEGLVRKELERVREKGIGERRLKQLKKQMRGQFLLGLESTGFRMKRMAISHIFHGRTVPVEEVLAAVDAVTNEDVKRVMTRAYQGEFLARSIIGPE